MNVGRVQKGINCGESICHPRRVGGVWCVVCVVGGAQACERRKKCILHMTMLKSALATLQDLFGRRKQFKDNGLFNTLVPNEVKLYIFSFLTVKELCTLALVCRETKILALDDSLWMRFFLKIDYIVDNSFPPPARVCHSAVVYEDSMYIYGGHIPDALNYIRDVKNDFYGYNFATRQWSVVGLSSTSERLPLKTEHTSVVYKNCMYMFGGYADSAVGYSDVAVYEYNFDTHTCLRLEAKGKAPPDRSAHTAVVYKDSMYILGGWDGNVSNNDFYVFHFNSHTWEEVKYTGTPPPCVRSHATVVCKDSMVVFGGYGIDNHPTSIFLFHFLDGRWEEIKPSVYPSKLAEEGSSPLLVGPCGRSRFRMVYYHESLWVVGGWDRQAYFADVWRFRFDNLVWHKVDVPFEYQGVGQHSIVVNKGRMYLYGGYCSDSRTPHPNLFVFRLPKVYNAEA